MKREIYLVVTIDTEADKDTNWQLQKPLKFSSVLHGIPSILMPLFNQHDITPTFLLSPEIIGNDDCVNLLASISNCELGTHLHGEFIEPQADWDADRTSMPQLLYPPNVEKAKLVNLTDLFKSRFGYSPTSFRAGRFGLSNHTLLFLQELGYKVDSSVTPFWSHYFEGRATRNFWGAPYLPYYPSTEDPRSSGPLRLLEVPVTIINQTMARWPKAILKRMENKTNLHRRLLRRIGHPVTSTVWLRPHRSTSEQMIDLAEHVISSHSSTKPIVLNMMYHSVEVIVGASPYSHTQIEVDLILQGQDALFSYLTRKYDVRSVGLSRISDLYMPHHV